MDRAEIPAARSTQRQPAAHREHDAPGATAQLLVDSPRLLAQRQRLQAGFGGALQLQPADEELPLQGRFGTVQRVEEDEPLQGKFGAVQRVEEEEPLQGRFAGGAALQARHDAAAAPSSTAPNRTGMPDGLKSGVEALSGMDLSDVRVHADSGRPAQLDALAYAQGNDIHLGPGQQQHLPHEAWHVVQQRQGRVQPTLQLAGVPVNDDAALEHEADAMGAQALQAPR